jgi:hypothetical protein
MVRLSFIALSFSQDEDLLTFKTDTGRPIRRFPRRRTTSSSGVVFALGAKTRMEHSNEPVFALRAAGS